MQNTQLSNKTYRWDVEELKDASGNTIKLFTLYDWEIFGEVSVSKTNERTGKEEEYNFTESYLKEMVANAQKEESTNYFLPVHTKHKDKDKNGNYITSNQPAGVVKGIRLEERDGESIIVAGQWTKIPEHIFNGILNYQWKYRSIEMNNYDNKRISSIAILDIEPPEFKFPITEVNVNDKEIPKTEESPVMVTSFGEENGMSLYFRESQKTINKKENRMPKKPKKNAKVTFTENETDKHEAAFKKAKEGSAKDCQEFLDKYPDSRYAEDVKKLLAEKTEMENLDKDKTPEKEKEIDTEEEAENAIKMAEDEEDDFEYEDDEAEHSEPDGDEFPESADSIDSDLDNADIEGDDDELLTVVMEFTEKMAKVDAKLDVLIGLLSGKNPQQPAQQPAGQTQGNPMPMQMSEQDAKVFKMAEKQKDAIAFMELRNKVEKLELKFTEVDNTNFYQDVKPFAREAIKIIENHDGTKADLADKIIKMSENYIGVDEWHEKGAPESALLTFKERNEAKYANRIPKNIPEDLRDVSNLTELRAEFEILHPTFAFSEDDKSKQLFFDHVRYRKNTSNKK